MQVSVGLLDSLSDWVSLQLWKSLVEFAKIFDLLVGCSEILVGLLINLFEVVGIHVIFAAKFEIESSDIGNEETSEDFIQFLYRNFLESFF